MTEEQAPPPNLSPTGTPSAEEKRMAARRRFLARGAAGGSGLLIVTLVHQRAFAQPKPPNANVPIGRRLPPAYHPHGILVSSTLTCTSMHGNAVATITVADSVTAQQVTRVDCVRD